MCPENERTTSVDEHCNVGKELSVPFVVYNIARYTAEKGHDVTILEKKWKGLKDEKEMEK